MSPLSFSSQVLFCKQNRKAEDGAECDDYDDDDDLACSPIKSDNDDGNANIVRLDEDCPSLEASITSHTRHNSWSDSSSSDRHVVSKKSVSFDLARNQVHSIRYFGLQGDIQTDIGENDAAAAAAIDRHGAIIRDLYYSPKELKQFREDVILSIHHLMADDRFRAQSGSRCQQEHDSDTTVVVPYLLVMEQTYADACSQPSSFSSSSSPPPHKKYSFLNIADMMALYHHGIDFHEHLDRGSNENGYTIRNDKHNNKNNDNDDVSIDIFEWKDYLHQSLRYWYTEQPIRCGLDRGLVASIIHDRHDRRRMLYDLINDAQHHINVSTNNATMCGNRRRRHYGHHSRRWHRRGLGAHRASAGVARYIVSPLKFISTVGIGSDVAIEMMTEIRANHLRRQSEQMSLPHKRLARCIALSLVDSIKDDIEQEAKRHLTTKAKSLTSHHATTRHEIA